MNSQDDRTPTTPEPSASEPTSAKNGSQQPPPGAHAMNVFRWALFAFLVVLAAVSIGSYVMSKRPATVSKAAAENVIYHCPMHPTYTSDKPGQCPICHMTLEPIAAPASGSAAAASDVAGLTSVQISPERIQMIGVRTARVERGASGGSLDLVGFVTPDESRLRRVQIRASGWIHELFVNETGARVTAGQPLMSIYSPELFQSEQEYLIQKQGPGANLEAAAERLRLLGIPDEEIRRLDREGKATTQLTLRSPVTGTVLERGVVQGQFVGADTPLLTVADLSRVWVLADVHEMDMSRVRVGDAARFTTEGLPGRSFEGRIEFVYPTISNETRTLKARLALANRGSVLRPGIYGRVSVSARGASALSVPAEAVIQTGEHSYVFLAHEGGRFEPRMVWTGASHGERVQILKGIAEGDTVVASASFLIDSESRLKAAIAGMGAAPGAGHVHGDAP